MRSETDDLGIDVAICTVATTLGSVMTSSSSILKRGEAISLTFPYDHFYNSKCHFDGARRPAYS